MISNTSSNANAIAITPPIVGTPASTHLDTHASPSEAAEFSGRIAYQESRRTTEAETRKLSETSDAIEGDVRDGAFVSRGSDRHLIKDDKTIADTNESVMPVLPRPMPMPVPMPIPVPLPAPASIPAADTPPVLVIDTPAVAQDPSKNSSDSDFPDIGPKSTNEELLNISAAPAAIVGNTIEPPISFATHGADVQTTEATSLAPTTRINNTIGKVTVASNEIADNAISASQSANVATIRPSSGDMQALVSEFETSVNHFERSGNQWVGNAKIVFQSTVLNGASVQITGDEKSLSILLTQSAKSSPIALLSRQEKQLCDALTRRLGRVVTLHVQQTFETQAADDTEPQ